MYSYCSDNLLNIKDVFIKKVVQADFFVKVFIETKPSPQPCPCCGTIPFCHATFKEQID